MWFSRLSFDSFMRLYHNMARKRLIYAWAVKVPPSISRYARLVYLARTLACTLIMAFRCLLYILRAKKPLTTFWIFKAALSFLVILCFMKRAL